MAPQTDVDVVIVGAGLAGLSAAATLIKTGYSVQVLEARNRVGGRTLEGTILGHPVDVGGQWVGPKHTRVLQLCEGFGLGTFPQHSSGKRILDVAGRVRVYQGLIPRLHPFALLELHSAINAVERMAAEIDPVAPWTHAASAEYDDITTAEWVRRRLRSRSARGLLDIVVRGTFAAEASEMSFLHFLTYIKQGGSLNELVEVTGGAQQDRIRGGAFQLARYLAIQIGANSILLGNIVQAIQEEGDAIMIDYARGRTIASRVIVAVPPPLVNRIAFVPSLDASRAALIQRMPMGSVIKVLVGYERPFWREQNLSGDAFSDTEALSPVYDACLPGIPFGLLVGFFEAKHAQAYTVLPQSERKRLAIDCLVKLFGVEAAHPIAYTDHDWLAEEWSRGCYAALAAPGAWTRFGRSVRQPHGRVHWAGTETANVWFGYMEGAIESGERAAREVQSALTT